jgi:mono/diheme cytochrome c family protein
MKKNKLFYLIIFISFNLFFLPVKSDPIFDKGKDIFLNIAVCSTCHILADTGSEGQIGPNLNEIRPDKIRVVNVVTNGIGVMPAYEGQLSTEEIDAVAHYVAISASQ